MKYGIYISFEFGYEFIGELVKPIYMFLLPPTEEASLRNTET